MEKHDGELDIATTLSLIYLVLLIEGHTDAPWVSSSLTDATK